MSKRSSGKRSVTPAELIAYVEFVMDGVDGEDARDIVATVIGHVVKALRADSDLPLRSTLAWEGVLAGAIDRATHDLRRLDGVIQPSEAVWAIQDFFSERGTEQAAPQASAESAP